MARFLDLRCVITDIGFVVKLMITSARCCKLRVFVYMDAIKVIEIIYLGNLIM